MGGFGFNKNKSKSSSGTSFNTGFLDSFEERYGGPPQVGQGNLPKPRTLFDKRTMQQSDELGFGKAPERTEAPTVGATQISAPSIGATPQAQATAAEAARVEMPYGSGQQFERAAFRSQFAPVSREFDRQAAEQRGQLQAGVAGAGLGSSAAGIGLMQKQAADQTATRTALASEAADRAALQRYGFEQTAALTNQSAQQQANMANAGAQNQMALANAERQQQTNLQQAGLDVQAQQVNAANILQGDLANASNYLAAIGLDAQQAAQARNDFLALQGLRQEDLARMDSGRRQKILDEANFWLQLFGQVAGASRFGSGSASGFGFNSQLNIPLIGGGGGG